MVTKCLVLFIFISTLSSHSATYVREKNPQTGLGRFWNRQYSSASALQCQFPRLAHGRTRARMRSKMVKFSCFPTYELVGNRYATCVDGEWDEPPPVCVRSGCQVPTKMENGVVLRNRNDAWLAFFCMPGFRLQGPPVVYCDGARWNSSMPACVGEILIYLLMPSCRKEQLTSALHQMYVCLFLPVYILTVKARQQYM
ncbi:hypothetical protein JYU34_019689 [Plutella xylostella]|uniref:Sushi domain-containing protein n=1 Tax=Plutella xylostella TaxID=51655 RepID=A0ABQ7PV23_PLUXY|nr:hypothetical protein JYU34_019689 [Plutella xylostella]